MVTLLWGPRGKPGHQHHVLLPHSVILSWHWGHQSLLYPNNADCLVRKWHVSIFKSSLWLNQGFRICIFQILRSPIPRDKCSIHSAIPTSSISKEGACNEIPWKLSVAAFLPLCIESHYCWLITKSSSLTLWKSAFTNLSSEPSAHLGLPLWTYNVCT